MSEDRRADAEADEDGGGGIAGSMRCAITRVCGVHSGMVSGDIC